jgi:hypothetical protein
VHVCHSVPTLLWLHLVRLPHGFPCSPSLFVWLFSRPLHTHVLRVEEWEEKRVEREKSWWRLHFIQFFLFALPPVRFVFDLRMILARMLLFLAPQG